MDDKLQIQPGTAQETLIIPLYARKKCGDGACHRIVTKRSVLVHLNSDDYWKVLRCRAN